MRVLLFWCGTNEISLFFSLLLCLKHSSSSYDKWISIAKQPASCDKLAAAYTMTNGTIPSEHAAVLKGESTFIYCLIKSQWCVLKHSETPALLV